jgi:predicted outer membrane repeat protein
MVIPSVWVRIALVALLTIPYLLTGAIAPVRAAQPTLMGPTLAAIRYAKPVASGSGNCASWANACTLQTALSGATSGTEIWVAGGIHKPGSATERTATFQLKDGVALYGGFAGTELIRDQRNPTTSLTVLSGDIDNNDSQTPVITNLATVTGNATNSYHVVSGATGATLDGFTITAGNANGTNPNNHGGGMYNESGSPTLIQVTFRGNSAGDGGGMYNLSGSGPTLTTVTFNANRATNYGGGMYTTGGVPTLTDVTFSNNTASKEGGGMLNDDSSNAILTNVTFNANSAISGGGMRNVRSNPALTNVTFSANSASTGGGIDNYLSQPVLNNVTLSGNSASSYGGGMYNGTGSHPYLRNTILWGNTADACCGPQIYNSSSTLSIWDSIVQGGYAGGTNIIITDPMLGPLGNNGGFTQTLALLPGSSAIDAGNDATCATTDQRGISRPQGIQCDIGAYELFHATVYYYVKVVASGAGNCQSWANACPLQTALAGAVRADEIWVAAGTHKPTTGNDRTATFQPKKGVALYGGFAGTESKRSDRRPATNATILSGDIGVASNPSDNVYHVFTGAIDVLLDGFTITAGNANGVFPNERGGGMYNNNSNPTVANVIFNANSATYGGGMYNNASTPTLTNVTFSANSGTNGGGMYNDSSSPTLTNVLFSANPVTGGSGGGMYNNASHPVLTHITFSGNSALGGGGLYNHASHPTLMNITFNANSAIGGGGMYNAAGSTPTVTNVTFSANTVTGYGGGMYNESSSPTLTNVTFSSNSATGGGGILNQSSNPAIRNTILWGNPASDGTQVYNVEASVPTLSDSVVQGGCPTGSTCTNILTTPPLLGPLGNYGGVTQTLPLLAGSSAIDTGKDAICPTNDQRGVSRPQGAHCDIGAYERTVYATHLPLVVKR